MSLGGMSRYHIFSAMSDRKTSLPCSDALERSLKSRRMRGDDLLNALDLADDLVEVGADVSSNGIVTLYHKTSPENAEEIARTGRMVSKEDRLFFGTSPIGQIDGYGDAVVRVHMPLERLELQAVMPNEAFVTVMSKGRPVRVDADVVTASRTAWSRDTLDVGSMCADCGSDLDIAGRIGDGDDLVCRDCHQRRNVPHTPQEPQKGKKWWWNASVGSRYHHARRILAEDTEHVYHGTSLMQLEAIRDAGWQVRDLYLADCREKSDDYAAQQANIDDAEPVVLQFDMTALRRMGQVNTDPGSCPEEREQDMGQFTYSGPLRETITNMDEVISELRAEGEDFAP